MFTFLGMNWKVPSISSLPQPATWQRTPLPLLKTWLNWLLQEGRHAVFTYGEARLMSRSTVSRAMSSLSLGIIVMIMMIIRIMMVKELF